MRICSLLVCLMALLTVDVLAQSNASLKWRNGSLDHYASGFWSGITGRVSTTTCAIGGQFNTANGIEYYCNGSNWVDPSCGTTNGACSQAGAREYAGGSYQTCDGSLWRVWGTTTCPPAATDPCDGSPAVGTVCNDGTLYAGLSSDGNVKMYTTRCDTGMFWDGNACTGTRATPSWGPIDVATGRTNLNTGKANSAALYALGTGYPAAIQCEELVENGRTDWYLPAQIELRAIYLAISSSTVISNSLVGGSTIYYWTSTENATNAARRLTMSNGSAIGSQKDRTNFVRCVRR